VKSIIHAILLTPDLRFLGKLSLNIKVAIRLGV